MKNINPTQTQAWQALEAHFAANKETRLKDLFAQDPKRFDKFSLTLLIMINLYICTKTFS